MKYSATKLAELLNGKLEGLPEKIISNVSKIEDAKEDSITFLSNKKYTHHVYTTKAGIIVVNKTFKIKDNTNISLIKVDNAYLAFVKLLHLFNKFNDDFNGISKNSIISKDFIFNNNLYVGDFSTISKNVTIEENVKIHNNVFIGDNVYIGQNTIVYSGVKILKDTVIGNNCIINSNSVLGSDGFGFAPNDNGRCIKIPQIGNVIIKNNVSIGALTTIDRATIGSTIIEDGVKLDNQIQIAHNVFIGKNTVIAAQSGIAGSTVIGNNCQIGGQSGVSGHLNIGDNVNIMGKSAVTNNVKSNSTIKGSPAFNATEFNRSYIHFKNLNKN